MLWMFICYGYLFIICSGCLFAIYMLICSQCLYWLLNPCSRVPNGGRRLESLGYDVISPCGVFRLVSQWRSWTAPNGESNANNAVESPGVMEPDFPCEFRGVRRDWEWRTRTPDPISWLWAPLGTSPWSARPYMTLSCVSGGFISVGFMGAGLRGGGRKGWCFDMAREGRRASSRRPLEASFPSASMVSTFGQGWWQRAWHVRIRQMTWHVRIRASVSASFPRLRRQTH